MPAYYAYQCQFISSLSCFCCCCFCFSDWILRLFLISYVWNRLMLIFCRGFFSFFYNSQSLLDELFMEFSWLRFITTFSFHINFNRFWDNKIDFWPKIERKKYEEKKQQAKEKNATNRMSVTIQIKWKKPVEKWNKSRNNIISVASFQIQVMNFFLSSA